MAKHILEFGGLIGVVLHNAFTRVGIEFSGRVPHGSLLFGGFVAFAFDGVQMKQLRPFHVFELLQHTHNFNDVVAIERTEIADVHAFEHVLLMAQCTLQCIVKADEPFAPAVVEITFAAQPTAGFEAQTVVGFGGV